jgi:dTMP kinase
MKGKFIVFEGIDGCGKGTQIIRLHNFLYNVDKRYSLLTSREPTYGDFGMKIRKILKEQKDPVLAGSLLFDYFVKDREEHVETVLIPFLSNQSGEEKKIALWDRYYHSTFAFQQAQGIPFDDIFNAQIYFPKPDITFIFDLDPVIALERISKERKSVEKFEHLEFMKILRKNYLDLKDKLPNQKIVFIDAEKNREEITEKIISILKKEEVILP